MCPNCRAFITTDDRMCPYCGQKVGPRAIDARQPAAILGGLIPHAHFTTILILIVNFGFFFGQLYLGNSVGEGVAARVLGDKVGPLIFQYHQYWRLVTAGFLHGGWLHILMNSWVLYDLGAQVEEVYGTPRFLVLYFAGTVGGFYLSALERPFVDSLGASAGITGLIGAMIAFGVANRSHVGRQIRDFYVRWVVYIIAFGLITSFTDNWAHIGGLAAGFCVGYVAGTPVISHTGRENLWRGLAIGCVFITFYCFFEIYRNFPPLDQLR